MRWEPITPENAVAKLSVASEHAICDFKARYDTRTDPTKAFEIAKDVCAFANHLGGTVLVGVWEGKGLRKGRISRFEELQTPSPGELVKDVERALGLYCRPVPVADAIPISLDESQVEAILGQPGQATTVVAINVSPSLSVPIGCLACARTCKHCEDTGALCSCNGKELPDAWRFPIRRIEGTYFLRPEELAKTMNVAERRALLDLQAIENEPRITVWFNTGDGRRGVSRPCKIAALDPDLMICTLELTHSPRPDGSFPQAHIPLTFVRATWRGLEGWNVAIDGVAFEQQAHPLYREDFMPPGGIR